jgi:Rieske Fe-S protein
MPSQDSHDTPSSPRPLSRREFAILSSLGLLGAACASDGGGVTAPAGTGITIVGNTMTVPLTQNPTLTKPGGIIQAAAGQVLIIRVSDTDYRALSSVCTHQACTVSRFDGTTLTCPCHGSQFAVGGNVTRGPATQALRSFPTSLNSTTGVLTVTLV